MKFLASAPPGPQNETQKAESLQKQPLKYWLFVFQVLLSRKKEYFSFPVNVLIKLYRSKEKYIVKIFLE